MNPLNQTGRILFATFLALILSPALAQQAPRVDVTEPVVIESARAEAEARRQEAELRRSEAMEQALEMAEQEQRAALEAVEAARMELVEKRQREEERVSRTSEAERARAEAEELRRMREVRRELEQAQEKLRRASREVSRVHRHIMRPARAPGVPVPSRSDRAVIGVVLGDSLETGVPILGVSPDGPAERAGLAQGDVIVEIMGEPVVVDSLDGQSVIGDVMKAVEVGDELVIAVSRDDQLQEFTVIADERKPFSWYSYVRLPSAPEPPTGPEAPLIPEAPEILIDVPSVDRIRLEQRMEEIREGLDARHIEIHSRVGEAATESWVFEFDEFSEFGDQALSGTSIWVGLPLTRGLKLAELEQGLGQYFNADEGVLVLRARDDNELQLQAGDVILQVQDSEVTRPADLMRALRNVESGDLLELRIMRDQKAMILDIEVPDSLNDDLFGFDLSTFDFQFEPDLHSLFVPQADDHD